MAGQQIKLIDADILTYRCGFAAQKTLYTVLSETGTGQFTSHKDAVEFAAGQDGEAYIEKHIEAEPLENALHSVNATMERLIDGRPYEAYLSGKDNFRKALATIKSYKANRKDVPRPIYYKEIREHLQNRWGAIVVNGQEADDEIGIRQYELLEAGEQPIIVTIDKDLDMLEGLHYNWVRDIMYCVGKLEAWRNYYIQTVTGDRTDNIPGIENVGPKTAAKLFEKCNSPGEMKQAALKAWQVWCPNGIVREDGSTISPENAFEEVAELLWIRRKRPATPPLPPNGENKNNEIT